jgi:hypothetical protein
MGNGGSSEKVGTKMVNSIVADVFVNVSLTCKNTARSEQIINVNCVQHLDTGSYFADPKITQKVPVDAQPHENNPTCRECMADILVDKKSSYQLQRAQWNHKPATVNLPVDQDYQQSIDAFINCGHFCKSCVYQNLSESTLINIDLNCKSYNTIKNQLTQKLSAQITQQLTNNKSFLAPLAQMLGAKTTQAIVFNLTPRVQDKITQEIVAAVSNTVKNTQNITIVGTDGTLVNNVSQVSAFNSVVAYFSKTKLFNSIFTDQQWKTLQVLYNDQNTIGDLGNTIVAEISDLSKMLTSVVGKVVVFMVILVVVIVVGIGLYVLILGLRTYIKHRNQKYAKEKADSNKLTAFRRF